jgi:hypothetical protein
VSAILCPRCPGCGGEPDPLLKITWPTQAWCGSDNCAVLVWDATITLEQNAAFMRTYDLEE